MSNQNLADNFDAIRKLYVKTFAEIYELKKKFLQDIEENVSVILLRQNLVQEIQHIHHQISKGLQLLAVNSLLLQDNDYESLHSEYIVAYDKLKEQYGDLKAKLTSVQLELDDRINKLVKTQRDNILAIYKEDTGEEKKGEVHSLADPRDLLFSRSKKDSNLSSLGTNEKILKANQSITATLQSTYGIMETNVMTSDLIVDTFNESTNSLAKLADKYDFLSSTLVSSKNLVSELQKANSSDYRKIKYSLTWFASCCLWVLWRRILRHPAKLLVWFVWYGFRFVLMIAGVFKSNDPVSVSLTESMAPNGHFATVSEIAATAVVSSAIKSVTDVVPGTVPGTVSVASESIDTSMDTDRVIQSAQNATNESVKVPLDENTPKDTSLL